MNLRAEVDQDSCISSGRCVAEAPEAFQFDADEIAQAVDGANTLERGRMLQVARGCPSGAIRVLEDGVPRGVD